MEIIKTITVPILKTHFSYVGWSKAVKQLETGTIRGNIYYNSEFRSHDRESHDICCVGVELANEMVYLDIFDTPAGRQLEEYLKYGSHSVRCVPFINFNPNRIKYMDLHLTEIPVEWDDVMEDEEFEG